MKKLFLLSLATLLSTFSNASADLVMTGLIDGPLTGGTPKAIEFYALADIPDLSIYNLELVSNANTPAGTAGGIDLSGSLTAGQFYYVASEAPEFTNVFGFAPNITNSEANHNGDDDFYLYRNGLVHDVWSDSPGIDNTGTVTDILDSWAYRLDNTGPSATFNAAEWTIAPVDSLDGLNAQQTAAAVPFGTYSAQAIPEPTSAALIGLGLVGIGLVRRRK